MSKDQLIGVVNETAPVRKDGEGGVIVILEDGRRVAVQKRYMEECLRDGTFTTVGIVVASEDHDSVLAAHATFDRSGGSGPWVLIGRSALKSALARLKD